MSKSCLAVAAEAAERVNAMLVAKGKLKINGVTGRSSGDLFTTEVEINDAPLPARNILTKGIFQEEICRSTGAVMSTRGRYMGAVEKMNAGSGDRALYLHIQAPTVDAIEKAMARISVVIREHSKDEANFSVPDPTAELVQQQLAESNAMAAAALSLLNAQATGHHYIQDKIFVGLEHAPVTFPVREKILGPGGSYLDHIKTTTGANVTLRGKGSGHLDPTSGREAYEPLHIHITHPTLEGLQAAKSLAVSLIQTTHTDFAEWQQQQLASLTLQSMTAQQLTSAASVFTGLGQVFQPVGTAGEVQAQGILVSPGVVGGQSTSIVLPMSLAQTMPSSVSYVTALPQTQATVMYPTAVAQLSPQQIQQLQQQHQQQQQLQQLQQQQQQQLQQHQLQQQLQQHQLQQQLQQQIQQQQLQQAQQQIQQAQQQAEQQLLQQQHQAQQQVRQAQQQQQQQQQAQAQAQAVLQAQLSVQQQQQPSQLRATVEHYQVAVPPPTGQSTMATATVYPHLRHQYAQYAAKRKYDVPPPSLPVPTAVALSSAPAAEVAPAANASVTPAATGAPAVLPATNAAALPLPTDTSVPPPNMAVPPPTNMVPPPTAVNTAVPPPTHTVGLPPPTHHPPPTHAVVPPPTNTAVPPPTNTAVPPPPTDTSVPPPNYNSNDSWRFRVPPPSMNVPPPLFPSAAAASSSAASSSHTASAPVSSTQSSPPHSSSSYIAHSGVNTSPPGTKQTATGQSSSAAAAAAAAAAASSSLTPLYFRSLRPQAKSSYLSSYQASALPEEDYDSYPKPTSQTNGGTVPSTASSGSSGSPSSSSLTETSSSGGAKKPDWEAMPPPSQTKATPPRTSTLGAVSYVYPSLKRPAESTPSTDWKRPRGAL